MRWGQRNWLIERKERSGLPAAGLPFHFRHNATSTARSLGPAAASVARYLISVGLVAVLCTACGHAGEPPAPVLQQPSLTGPVLHLPYEPEPDAVLALASTGEELALRAPWAPQEAAGSRRGYRPW